MRGLRVGIVGAAVVVTVVAIASASRAAPRAESRVGPRELPGWVLYDRYCVSCHGAGGTGRGPAAPFTQAAPRDLTAGVFAWRTTASGSAPTRTDLSTTIRYGAPGTSMPAFVLEPAQIDALVDVVLAFGPAAPPLAPAPTIMLGPPPAPDAARGARLWSDLGCASCHGADGRGDGPAARALVPAPYDLTREPLHRPRIDDTAGSRRAAAAMSIATGLAGTAMPGYAGTIPVADVWALADRVDELAAVARDVPGATPASRSARVLSARAISADVASPVAIATWPGADEPDEAAIFGAAIAAQGPPPASLAPAEASLAPRQCARCHAKQYREWEPSRHHGAASPGVAAQMAGIVAEATRTACLRCHAPLAEQRTDATLRADGASCAGCHVRAWTRHGPPRVAPSLLPDPGYPLQTLALYERSDFCLPCHQLPPRTAVAGKPLLDTYREWLESPYAARGVECQHCHMPNREHSVLGVHDPETFRQGIALAGHATRAPGRAEVTAQLANVGAGHMLPTTTTPAVWLRITLLDAHGRALPGATTQQRIGRDVALGADHAWHERSDTRIAPGTTRTLTWRWSGARADDAVSAQLTVDVSPDDYYERLYRTRLAGTLTLSRRALYGEALDRARAAHYLATTLVIPIAAPAAPAAPTGTPAP